MTEQSRSAQRNRLLNIRQPMERCKFCGKQIIGE
jgi:hypothetical protein